MNFARPELLLLLWLLPLPFLMIFWMRRRRRRRATRIIHPNALRKTARETSDTVARLQLGLCAAAMALLVVAAAGPRWGLREEIVLGSGRNVLILLDVSRSMLATDVRPNRLERAKADLTDLLAELEGDRAGIMAFRSGAVLLCPFTTDLAFLNQTLAGIGIDSAPRGETDIGEAIDAAIKAFEELGADHNAIILISDGEDLTGQAAAKAAKAGERGIPIFCVGIGGTGGSTIPATDSATMKYRGEAVVTRLDNETLMAIATASRGAYIPLATAATGRNTLGGVYNRHVRQIAAQEMQEMRESRLVEHFQLFLVPGVILLLVAAALSSGRPAGRRPPVQTAAALLLLALAAGAGAQTNETTSTPAQAIAASAESARDTARRAQKAWRKGDYADAAKAYEQAIALGQADPELAQSMRFNAALAFLKAGNAGKAAELFRQAAATDGNAAGADAAEGLGVALFRAAEALAALEPEADAPGAEPAPKRNLAAEQLELFEEAAAAFQDALRGLPESPERNDNLQAALARIPELREKARTEAILAKYGDMPPEQLVPKMLEMQRAAFAQAANGFTNASPDRIAQLEQTATRQQEVADLWMPLHGKMADAVRQSTTNENLVADFIYHLDAAKSQAESAVGALENLDPGALDAMRAAETESMRLLAMTTPPPVVLAEAIRSQSNALARALDPSAIRKPLEEQQMTSGLFRFFSESYGPWLDQQAGQPMPPPPGQEGAAATNAFDLSAEVRKLIDDLVAKTLGTHALVQMDVAPADTTLAGKSRLNAEQALKDMLHIQELLPKPPQQQQQKQQQQQQQQEKQDQQQSQGRQGEQPPSDDEQQQKQEPEDAQPEQEPESQDAESQPQEPQEDPAETAEAEQQAADQKEAEAIMARILEQEKQRENERRKHDRSLPPRVGERDW
ncbi:MAG: VWA domain-containing protein [Kiritimatiellia bacterium]|jgi:Ca-activated chloride channel family protein